MTIPRSIRRGVKRAAAPVAVHLPHLGRAGVRGAILYYHAIAETAGGLAVSVDAFRAQMRLLAEEYEVVPLGELVGTILRSEGADSRKPLVAVTFDDGYASVVRLGLPILQECGLNATIFAVTGAFGEPPAWIGAKKGVGPLMSLGDAERWVAAGMGLESHTATHRSLATLSANDLEYELEASRKLLQGRFGSGRGLAYPWGHNGQREQHAAEAAGYDYAVAIAWNRHHRAEDRFALARMPVVPDDRPRDIRLKLRGGYDWLEAANRLLTRGNPVSSGAAAPHSGIPG